MKQVFLYKDEATNTHWTFLGERDSTPDLTIVPDENKFDTEEAMLAKAVELAQANECSCFWIDPPE